MFRSKHIRYDSFIPANAIGRQMYEKKIHAAYTSSGDKPS